MENLELINIFKNKRILVTGHTGFKGSWLILMLNYLGACVYGLSLKASKNSLYEILNLDDKNKSYIEDIRNKENIKNIIKEINPEIIFHLAAQPLVLESYNSPVETFETNIIGAINVMEAAKELKNLKALIMITTDKVYENKEYIYAYREIDRLGGNADPYSASKAACEIAISSYRHSFIKNFPIVSVRAGNVIGGGDFSENRIIPDIVRSIENNEDVTLRNPTSVRPWQHVLDCLYGYILVAKNASENKLKSNAYNFAPLVNSNTDTVQYITNIFIKYFGKGRYRILENSNSKKEMKILRLDSSLARSELNWSEQYNTEEAIKVTAEWYKAWIENQNETIKITNNQIENYFKGIK